MTAQYSLYYLSILCLIFCLLILGACSEPKQIKNTPLGDKAVLEELAQSYSKISDKFPVSPTGLTPKGRRQFVEEVFQTSNYDYSRTLTSLAKVPINEVNQNHKDLKQLLFLPHYGRKAKDSAIYTTEELQAIYIIEKIM